MASPPNYTNVADLFTKFVTEAGIDTGDPIVQGIISSASSIFGITVTVHSTYRARSSARQMWAEAQANGDSISPRLNALSP